MNTKSQIDKKEIDKEKLIGAFQQLGFSPNDSKVYISLLYLGPNSPIKISHDTEIDRSRVYDCLRRLQKKGYIIEEPTQRAPNYKANDPKPILSNLRKEYREKIEITESLEKMLKNYTPPKSKPFLVSIKGENAIFNSIKTLINNAEKFLQFIITPDISKNRERFPRIVNILVNKKRNNPNIRMEVAVNLKMDESQFLLKKLHEDEISVYLWEIGDVLPYGLYLSEKSYVFTTLDAGTLPTYNTGLTIENAHSDMLNGLIHLFQFHMVSYGVKGKMKLIKKFPPSPPPKQQGEKEEGSEEIKMKDDSEDI